MDPHLRWVSVGQSARKPLEIVVGRGIEVHGDVDIRHAEPAEDLRLVHDGVFEFAVGREVDDRFDALVARWLPS